MTPQDAVQAVLDALAKYEATIAVRVTWQNLPHPLWTVQAHTLPNRGGALGEWAGGGSSGTSLPAVVAECVRNVENYSRHSSGGLAKVSQ
jgi:hypothetical protein